MKTNEQFFSFKRNPKNEVLIGVIIICSVISIGFILYTISDKLIFDKFDKESIFGEPDGNFGNTKMMFTLALIILLIIIGICLVYCLFRGILYLFKRERVVLAKVVRMSIDRIGDLEDSLDFPNASLPKTLAKNFSQVTFHQIAKNGKISNIYIYASQSNHFKYPSESYIFSLLSGVCKRLGLVIEPFSKQDYENYQQSLNSSFGNPTEYCMEGLIVTGEPAYQHTKRFTAPVDGLVETIVSNSKNVDIHTFSTIRQCNNLRLRIRERYQSALTRKKTSEELNKKQRHFAAETEEMTKSGIVKGEIALVVKGQKKHDVNFIKGELDGSLLTIFDGLIRNIELSSMNPKRILKRIKRHELAAKSHKAMSGYSARAIIDVYRKPMSGIPIVKDITTPPSEIHTEATHPIVLGETITGEKLRIGKDTRTHHTTLIGSTGYGKSHLIRAETEQFDKHNPELMKLIIANSNEDTMYYANKPNYLVFEANSKLNPLHINSFHDKFVSGIEFADFLFKYFNETIASESPNEEYSFPQKEVLSGAIDLTVNNPDLEQRNMPEFIHNLEIYAEINREDLNQWKASWKAVKNRLRIFRRELRNVVWANTSNLTMDLLEKTNIVINLQNVRGTDAKKAIIDLILFQLRNYVFFTKPLELSYLVYIDDAQLISTKKGGWKRTLTFVEECLSEIRKHGVGIILITPTDENITGLAFESKCIMNFAYVSKQLVDVMNYTSIKDIHTLKKFQCDVKLPNEEYPIRLVKLTRPQDPEISYEQYQTILATDVRYEAFRNTSYLLETISDHETVLEAKRRAQDKETILTTCLASCPFYFTELKECFLMKRKGHKVNETVREVTGIFLHEVCSSWEGVKSTFENDFKRAVDEIASAVMNQLPENVKIDDDKKESLTCCVLIRLLRVLLENDFILLSEAEGFLLEYDEYVTSQYSSPYGFDDADDEEYELDLGDYDEYWEDL